MSVLDFNLYEQRREEILNVARDCFAEKGYNATTMVEVARRTGMSVGNLYNYFHGKVSIIESLAEREVKKLADRVTSLRHVKPTRDQRYEHLYQLTLDTLDPKRSRVAIEIFAEAIHNEQLRQIIVRIDEKMRELLVQMYRSYGEVDEEWNQTRISADMAMVDGLAIRMIAQGHVEREKLAREIAYRVLGEWDHAKRENKELTAAAA